nr:hypothetical protein CPGR_01270 [Mycolicibacterium fortuitum subsp. fortuitum DSM 46621 = ATCC 6841 = JCM 6387]
MRAFDQVQPSLSVGAAGCTDWQLVENCRLRSKSEQVVPVEK